MRKKGSAKLILCMSHTNFHIQIVTENSLDFEGGLLISILFKLQLMFDSSTVLHLGIPAKSSFV